MCVPRVMPLTRLCSHCRNAGEDWDLRSASGKMLKVWGMREVAYNALDLQGRVFTGEDSVCCHVRLEGPLLSQAVLEDKGSHMTVKDGCRKLGGHGREMNLQRQGNSYLVDMAVSRRTVERKRKRLGSLLVSWLLWTVGVAGLSATAGVERETSRYHWNTRSAQS